MSTDLVDIGFSQANGELDVHLRNVIQPVISGSSTAWAASTIEIRENGVFFGFTDTNGHTYLALVPWSNISYLSQSISTGSPNPDFTELKFSDSGNSVTVQITSGGGYRTSDSLEMSDEGVFVTESSELFFYPWGSVFSIIQQVS
jgi:hypothetical protein